jgi:hypothetical protein
MPIAVEWLNDDRRVIREVYTGAFDFEELDAVIGQVVGMLGTVDHPVDLFLILKDIRMPENAIAGLPGVAKHTEFWNHPRLGRLVIIGAARFIKTILNIYNQVYPAQARKFLIAETEAEAYVILRGKPRPTGTG